MIEFWSRGFDHKATTLCNLILVLPMVFFSKVEQPQLKEDNSDLSFQMP